MISNVTRHDRLGPHSDLPRLVGVLPGAVARAPAPDLPQAKRSVRGAVVHSRSDATPTTGEDPLLCGDGASEAASADRLVHVMGSSGVTVGAEATDDPQASARERVLATLVEHPEIAESTSGSPCTETPRYRRTVRRTATHVAPSPNDKPGLFRVGEVAAILRVLPTTIYRLMRLGEFQCVHVGRSMRIPRTSFEAFTTQKPVTS
jgi:excisionase family DNA binding protein